MPKPFIISVGPSRLSTRLTQKKVSWGKLAARLQKYDVVDCTYAEYQAMPRDEQSDAKDVGYFIGGRFSGTRRVQDELLARCCISLDIDHIDWLDLELIRETYAEYEYVVHSTMKHSDDTPRLRLIFPLKKEIEPEQYEPIARMIASQMGMECFDDTTFQPARIMFWPAVTSDGDIYKEHNKGSFLSGEHVLLTYDDWTDFGEWPHSSRVNASRGVVKFAENPLTKPGIIGAFNRTFDIHAAIARFNLPYESTDFDNRYLPAGSTGAAGAVVYDDVFLYSNHESDVVGLQNVNAWDLVRAHRFGSLDDGIADDVRMSDRPSMKEMTAMALNIPEVHAEMVGDELQIVPTSEEGVAQHATPVTGMTFKSLLDEINTIDTAAPDLYDVCQSQIPRIAAARLDPHENSILTATLRDQYPVPKPTKSSIEQTIERTRKGLTAAFADGQGGSSDIEQNLIQTIFDEHFDGGKSVKRVSRKYWTYQNGLWAIDSDERIKGQIVKTLSRLRIERPNDMLELVAAVGDSKTSTLLRSLWEMMVGILAAREARDDPLGLMRKFNTPIINCMNCELHFDYSGNMTVQEHSPNSFFTTRINADYNPKAKCPEWDSFNSIIWSNTADPIDMQRHIEELGGYIIQMSRWIKTWVLFHGPKDAGKSTLAQVFELLLGNAYSSKPMATLADPRATFAASGLIGKLLMVDDDFAYGNLLPDGFLKMYSEEKSVTADIKFGDNITFQARALPLILSNHYPHTRDITGAFLERALVLPFSHRITGSDKSDARRAQMFTELPGIANRFVEGLKRLRKRGNWDLPIDCIEASNTWAAHANPAIMFVRDYLNTNLSPQHRIPRARLFQLYRKWDNDQGGGNYRMKKGQFFERMSEILGEPVKSGTWEYVNVSEKKARIDEFDDENDWE